MNAADNNLYKSIIVDCITKDIDEAYKANIYAGCVILILCAIDAMAALSMPNGQKNVTKNDFIDWVGEYMKTDKDQTYQYDPIDLYGARCGIVHRYSAESDLSDLKNCKIFVYYDGSDHCYDSKKANDFVEISIPRLKEDFKKAVINFLEDACKDVNLKNRIDSRITKLFQFEDV
ncbi:MAG: hypothetical protein M1365_12630 [Actinobacteria bacterium]|nr:hypothetical protein [Actinomycetota bacterium]